VDEDNLSNVRRETSRLFRYKKMEYVKDKYNEFESDHKIKTNRDLYRSIIEFKKGYNL
jgi:hypothetical protein